MDQPLYQFGDANVPEVRQAVGRWIILGSRTDGSLRATGRTVDSLDELLASGADIVFFLEPALAAIAVNLVGTVIQELAAGPSIAVLVARAEPPTDRARSGGAVRSIAISADLLRTINPKIPDRLHALAFDALLAVATGRIQLRTLIVRQFPERSLLSSHARPLTVIVPHRGSVEELKACLQALERAVGPGDVIRVGLDEEVPSRYAGLIDAHPGIEFYSALPAPVGPDAIRQVLIERSPEGLIAFQDSDDLPCSDRFAILRAAIENQAIEFVGSHELRVDELQGEVLAIRYPIQAWSAMAEGPGNPLLLPATMITAEAFHRAGDFPRPTHSPTTPSSFSAVFSRLDAATLTNSSTSAAATPARSPHRPTPAWEPRYAPV